MTVTTVSVAGSNHDFSWRHFDRWKAGGEIEML